VGRTSPEGEGHTVHMGYMAHREVAPDHTEVAPDHTEVAPDHTEAAHTREAVARTHTGSARTQGGADHTLVGPHLGRRWGAVGLTDWGTN